MQKMPKYFCVETNRIWSGKNHRLVDNRHQIGLNFEFFFSQLIDFHFHFVIPTGHRSWYRRFHWTMSKSDQLHIQNIMQNRWRCSRNVSRNCQHFGTIESIPTRITVVRASRIQSRTTRNQPRQMQMLELRFRYNYHQHFVDWFKHQKKKKKTFN